MERPVSLQQYRVQLVFWVQILPLLPGDLEQGQFFSPQPQGVRYGLSMVTEPWLAHSRCSGSPWGLSGAL